MYFLLICIFTTNKNENVKNQQSTDSQRYHLTLYQSLIVNFLTWKLFNSVNFIPHLCRTNLQIFFIMKPQLKIINFKTEKKEHIYRSLTEGLKGKTIDWPMTGETMLINQFGRKGVIRRNRIYEIRLSLKYQSINRYCSGVNVLRYVSLNLIKTPFRLVLWNKSSQTIYNYFTE